MIHVLSAPDILVAITRCARATVMARRWGDFSSSLSRKLSHSTFEKRPDRRCAWGEGEGSSCPGSARCAKPRRRTPARSRGRTITSSRSGRRGAYASWCALPQRVVAFSSPQILRSAEPLDHAFAARIADLTPFPRPQTPQNPADIDGPAGCVSLVDDARAKPAATTGHDDAEDDDEDDAGVPFPPLPTPRRSTALLSTRAVLHPNHRPEVVARDIAWSPLGLAPASSDESSGDDVLGGGGCLLAVASGSHHVTVHAPPTSQSNAEWRKVLDISEMFVSAAESHGWLEGGGGDELDLRARFESNESNEVSDAPKSLVSLETQLLRAREAPASLPPATAASNGTGGGTTVPRPSLPAAKGVETIAAATEDVPADSLRVGAAVEVRASSSNTAESGPAGGWRPGVIESLISAFNFRVRVRFAEPARGERGDLWLTIENPSEFPSLRLDHVGCHEFPSQSLVYQGASWDVRAQARAAGALAGQEGAKIDRGRRRGGARPPRRVGPGGYREGRRAGQVGREGGGRAVRDGPRDDPCAAQDGVVRRGGLARRVEGSRDGRLRGVPGIRLHLPGRWGRRRGR